MCGEYVGACGDGGVLRETRSVVASVFLSVASRESIQTLLEFPCRVDDRSRLDQGQTGHTAV